MKLDRILTMITLYNFQMPTRATRVIWTLHELEMAYEIKLLNAMAGDNRKPEYLAINPTGKVPSISHNGNHFTESLAIMEYLNDLHPDKPLTPNIADADYAMQNYQFRQALSYAVTEIESYAWVNAQSTMLKMIYKWPDGTAEEAKKRVEKALPIVWQWLQEREYIAGDVFTLADIYYYQLLGWVKMLGVDLPEHALVYLKKLKARDKFPEVLKK